MFTINKKARQVFKVQPPFPKKTISNIKEEVKEVEVVKTKKEKKNNDVVKNVNENE